MTNLAGRAFCFLLVLSGAREAEALEDAAVVVVAEGPDARAAREEIRAHIGDGYAVIDATPLVDALAQQGQKGAMGPILATPKRRAALWEKMRIASKSAQVEDVVLVVTSRTRSGRKTATVYVWDAAGGASPELHAGVATQNHALADAVSAELTELHPAPPPAPVSTVPTPASTGESMTVASGTPSLIQVGDVEAPVPGDQAATAEPIRLKHIVGREWFQVSAGIEGGMRHFSYNEGLTGNLRSYQLNAAPLASVDGALYPFAPSGYASYMGLSDVGVVGGYARAFAVESQSNDAGNVSTVWQRFYVGGRVRARTAKSPRAVVLGLTGAYGGESFSFDTSSTAPFPSVSYQFVSAEGEVRIPIRRFAVTAGGGYLFVLSAGDVAQRFPQASEGGIDANLQGAFTILPGLEARLTVSYRRFFYSMNPVPGDSYVAGGALDEFWRLNGSLAYVY
jgi:hypothetical protein